MAENNPGQDNIAFDATTNQPRLKVDVTYDDKTSLDGIKAKYTDIGKQYNRFVTDARENVHDRQVEHIGNNFGASPYNTNTYYEPAATDFASAMRQQGTQQAFEVGMDRGKKEAEANLNAQKAAYENAATAYNNAYTQYQQTKSSPTMAPVDKSLLPGGVNEDEFLNYVKNAGTPAEGLQRAIDKLGLNNAGVKDWNDQDIVSKVKNELGENSDAWEAYAKHMEERGSNGVSERYADTELGRIWADTYAKNYFKTKYDDSYVAKWQTEYDKTRRLVNNIMGLRNGELHWTDTIVPTQDLPDNVPAWTDLKYIDIIQPEFKDIQDTSLNHVHYDNGTYTIDGRAYTEDEVRQKVANAKGTTVEELDKKFSPLQTTEFHNTSGVAGWQDSKIKTNFTNRERWTPTTKEVWEAFAGGENAAKEYAGYTTVGLVSADDVAQAVLGVNIKEAKAVAQFKSENPDGYERLTDQMTRAYTDATVFEVADGKKAYHTRDGYKVLSAGTVVMNVPDAVLDENGEIFDEDLKRMKQLYQERDNGTVNQAKLAEEFEKAREAYAKRIMLARAVTNQTDGQIDKDIYSAILYSSDKKKYKDLKIGDKTAEELLNEFRDKVERKPEDAYREFSGLWELAYQNLGYFFAPTSDGYVTKKLYDKDGNSLVGRYGEDNKPKDKSSNYAMALVSLYANSMDAFTSGSKDGNIDPKFLKADGAEGILYNTLVGTGKILQGNAAFIAGAATGSAIGSAIAPGVGSLIGGLIGGIGGTVASVLTSDGKFHPGDIGYDADHNNNSSKLLRNAINPLSSALWGLDDSKPTRLGQTNDVSQVVEDFISGSASFMGELAIEAIITGMAGRFGEMARVGIQKGVGTAARNLLNAGQQFTIKSLADDVTRGVVKDLMDPSDEIAEDVANKYIKDVAKDKADDILGAATKKASTETSVIKGLSTVPSLDQLDDASRNIIGALNTSANETTSKFMQIVSKLANNVDDLTDFSYKFAKNATRFITKESVIDSLAKAGYTGLDDATVNAALEYTRTQIAHLGGAAARQTYQTALISGFLGLAPEQVAKAPANVLTYLSKSIGQFYDNPNAFPGVFGAILEGEMSKDAIKRSFSEILEISAAAAQSGVKFSTDDVVRHLAASGWNKARLAQLTKNITLSRQGLADDIFHDIVNGYTVPQMDEEGNYHQVTIDEYFASGQILSPFIMNGMQLAIGGVFRRIQSAAVRAKLDKANAALAATAMDSPDYAARYKAVQKYTAKAAKISDKLLDGNISYSKMKEVADKGIQYLKDADKKLFEGIERDIKAVDKNFSKKTRAQQAEFLKKRFKATDALAQAYTNAQVGAFVKYPYFKKLLGGDVANTLATLEDRATISKIWDAMNDAAEKNRDAVLGNKRLKGFWAKQAEMRKLQKEAAKEALRGPNGEVSVLNLESSLDSWFNMIDDVARRNVAEGVMTEDQLRLGYLPETGMLIGKPGDGVPAPARALWMGEDSGNAMAISSADPVMKREVYIKDLINAYKEGKTEVTLADGSTREFNPQGFSFLDAAIAYNNANTFHRTVGSIIGSGKKSAGAAAVQSGYVQFHGANASKAAAQADLDIINANISKLEETAKKSMTEAVKAEDIKTRERAKKALSDISKLENKIMETIGQQQVSAENLRKAADVLEQIATQGRRSAGAPSAKELLGIKDDSEAQKVFNAAKKRVAEDIKKVQSGEKLSTKNYDGPTLVISGAQTGVDTLGLEVANELGYKTGGTTTPGFYRETKIDKHTRESLSALGVKEITPELQAGKQGKEFYLPRTEQNVKNSDATVYFASDSDSAGLNATRRFAQQHKKPFLLNPDAAQLRTWLAENNVGTLNIAGNRGSKMAGMDHARDVLAEGLNKNKKFASSINNIDTIYEDMIRNAAKNNGHFDYDVVARRMLLDNYKPTEKTLPIKEVVGNRLEEVTDFENQPTQINLKYDKNTKSYKSSTLGELSKLDMDNATTKAKVDRELTRLISNDYNSSDRGLKEQYMRAVQDAFSQAKTIMNDQIKLEGIDMNEGGFSHGFFTYLDIVDRILPDKDLYRTAVDTKLVNKLNNLSRDGITLSQLKESILNKVASERLAGNSIDDLVTAYKVLDLADDAGVRATGTGSYESGRLKDMLFEDDGSDAAATDYRLGVSDLYGNKIDTSDMYAQDFNPESLMANRSKNPAQIDYDKLSAKDKSIYNMVRSGVDLSNKEELNEALKTTASILNKLTNNGSKLYDASLNAARKEASGVVEMAKTIRDEINKAVNELASKDKEIKKLIESEAARRSARQTKFNKTSTDNATYDGAAALGIARPQSAVLYSESPAKYNAIAAAIRNNEAGLANTVRAMKAEGVPDAQSILGYFREGRKGVEDLDSLINFDAGSNAGIYQQLKAATDYLKEKGVNTKNLDEKLSEMKSKISDVNSYGDIYGNYNPPEYSLSAALAEVEGKTSFFPDNLRNGIDRLRTDEAGPNTWKATQPETTIDIDGKKVIAHMSFGTTQELSGAAVGIEFTTEYGDDFDFGSLSDSQKRIFAKQYNDQTNGFEIVKSSDYTTSKNVTGTPILDENGRLVKNPDGTVKRITAREAKERLKKIAEEKKEVAQEMATARAFGDLSENAEYSAAIERMKALDSEEEAMKDITSGSRNSSFNANILQELDGDWYLVSKEGKENADVSGFFKSTSLDEKWASYLADTAKKESYKDMMDDIKALRKKASKLDSKTEKLSETKVDVNDGTGKIKQQSLKSVVEDAQDVNYKRYLSKEDYAKYQELKKSRGQINDYLNDKAEVYHALTGATFNGDAPGYSNMVRLSDFLAQYGYTPDAKELDASKFDAKKMGKELRKSNLATKKNWGSYRIDPTVLPSSMDKESAELTVANLLKFAKEAREATGLNYIDFDQMWVDKSYLELLARYSNRPLDPRGLMGFAAKVSTFPNWIQQQQLAGGWGPINALTLAGVRSAILEDPAKAVAFAKMLADMRNSKAALNSIISRSDLLSRIALETGDGSIVTDLYPVMSRRAGRDDGGVIQTFANKILDRGNNAQAYSRFPKGFRANIKQDVEDFFETPTFAQAMPVLRAQMISMNYDSALSHLNKKFAKRIGKDISAEEIQNAAMQVAYARTQKFFTPQKYWNENYKSGLQRIKNENVRKMVGQITGEGTPTTILDVASNAFFALRYKQTFVNRFVQGFKEMASLPKMIKHQLSQSASLDDVTSDLTKVGQIRGAVSLIGISVLAKIWCDALGIPNAWDDFDFNPEGDEVFHMPSVLMKFQNAGQIWMPNSGQLDLSKGIDWGHSVFGMSVDPNKQAYKIDPMFSMFTMPNTVFRAFNMAFNGGTDSYKAPQRGLPFLPSNGVINSMVNSNVGRALGDELIGSNLLSPFKALHEVITNSTYFGNNIWERKYLPDGSENPNYDPGRNAASSVMHLLGLDQVLDPNGYNRWVKGGNNRVKQDQVGTIAGSGILQHEYLTAAIHLLNGDIYEAAVEAGELPIKSQKLATGARTEMNTIVKNTLDHYGDEYREAIKHASSTDAKDKAYAEYMKKSADEVARWSKKYGYVLGKNQELVASMTRMLTAMTSGEYDDNMAYVQDTYWKASKIAQIESGANLFLKDSDLDDWLANGGTVESFAEEKERRSQAYNQALDDEYEARKALIDANYKPEYLAGSSYEDLRAEQRAVSKKVYTAIMSKFEKQVGEFKNFKEMKSYYENMINSASTTKQKAKYAETYNGYVKEIIAAALADNKLDATVLNEATYNGKGLATQLSDYIIIPAGTYYTGKSPKTSYLKDLFEVGYKSRAKLPSDDEVREKWDTVKWLVSHGKPASAASVLEQTLRNVKNGSLYISDVDYSNMVRLQSKLRSKQ